MDFVQPQFCAHGVRHVTAVAGQHDAFFHAGFVQVANCLFSVVLHHVRDDDVAHVRAVDAYVQDGAGELAVVPGAAVGAHELVVADQHHTLVNHCAHTMPGLFFHILDALLVDVSRECFAQRYGDGMV